MNVQINIDGDPKATLLFNFAFEHDKLGEELMGRSIDKANALLFQYGTLIVGFDHHDSHNQIISIKALTRDEVFEAKLIADDYNAWLIGTSGPYDFPCPSPRDDKADPRGVPLPREADAAVKRH